MTIIELTGLVFTIDLFFCDLFYFFCYIFLNFVAACGALLLLSSLNLPTTHTAIPSSLTVTHIYEHDEWKVTLH